MASAAVGQHHDHSSHYCKRAHPNCNCSYAMGDKWAEKTVRALCDNMAIIHVLHSRQSKDQEIMHILVNKYLPGKLNILADVLSQDKLQLFHSNYPKALPRPYLNSTHPAPAADRDKNQTVHNLGKSLGSYYLQGLAKLTQKTYFSKILFYCILHPGLYLSPPTI